MSLLLTANDAPAAEEQLLDQMVQNTRRDPNWLQVGVLQAIRLAMEAANISFASSDDAVMRFFTSRSRVLRLHVPWDRQVGERGKWSLGQRHTLLAAPYSTRSETVDAYVRYAFWEARVAALRLLTLETVQLAQSGEMYRVIDPDLRIRAWRVPAMEGRVFDDAFDPVPVTGCITAPSWRFGSDVAQWRDACRSNPVWNATVHLDGRPAQVSLLATVGPMVINPAQREAYVPLSLCAGDAATTLPSGAAPSAGEFRAAWAVMMAEVDAKLQLLGGAFPPHRAVLEHQDLTPVPTRAADHANLGRVVHAIASRLEALDQRHDETDRKLDVIAEIDQRLSAIDELLRKSIASHVNAAAPAADWMTFDAPNLTATFSGETFPLSEQAFEILRVYYNHSSGWVGTHDLRREGVEVGNVSRIVHRMQTKIRELIETSPGKGHRLLKPGSRPPSATANNQTKRARGQ